MGDTSIQWTDKTWNPVRGCIKVSPGCKNCYAETFAERWRGVAGHAYEQGFDLRLVPEKLKEPFHWKKPRRIFVIARVKCFVKQLGGNVIDSNGNYIFNSLDTCKGVIYNLLMIKIRMEQTMTYQITYYADPAMTSRQADTDTIPDAALASYPAPNFPETAIAAHQTDQSLTRYGYAGAWHSRPPQEAIAADRKASMRAKTTAELRAAQELLQGQGIAVRRADYGVRVIQYDGQQPRDTGSVCTWSQLAEACDQPDIEAATLYRAIRTVAKAE